MNVWEIDYYLKNGDCLTGVYEGAETSSNDVCKNIIAGPDNEFSPIYSDSSHKGVLLVRKGDISAVRVTARNKKII